jgi:hypothetical protein
MGSRLDQDIFQIGSNAFFETDALLIQAYARKVVEMATTGVRKIANPV